MDLFTQAGVSKPKPTPMDTDARRKRQAAEGADVSASSAPLAINDEQVRDLVKLVLSNTQCTRMLKAAVLRTFKFFTDSPWIVGHRQATTQFNTAAEALRKEKGPEEAKEALGHPGVHGFNALVKQLLSEMCPDQQVIVKQAIDKWNWKTVSDEIKTCRVEKMMESKFKRLVICCPAAEGKHSPNADLAAWTPTDCYLEMIKIWNAPSSKVKDLRGQAPAGDLERKMQQYLNDTDA
jgi:hypothetical protein